MEEKQMSRSDLYQAVWKKPITVLAQEFGYSDKGLAKICKKYNIPRPGRGYWAKKKFNRKVRKTPLSKPKYNPSIKLEKTSTGISPGEFRKEKLEPVPISPDLRKAHQVVRELKKKYKTAYDDDRYGNRKFAGVNGICISVTDQLFRRALIIADSLIKELTKRGYLEKKSKSIFIHDQSLGFVIEEPCKQVKTKNPPGHYNEYNYKYPATGKLKLRIIESYWDTGARKTWSDGKEQKIEDGLPKFIRGLELYALNRIRIEREREERERQRAKSNIGD